MDFKLPPNGTFLYYTGPPYNFTATVFAGSTILFNDTKIKGCRGVLTLMVIIKRLLVEKLVHFQIVLKVRQAQIFIQLSHLLWQFF